MATFKIGDRVRVVALPAHVHNARLKAVGREATIVALPSMLPWADCDIEIDGFPARDYGYADLPWAVKYWQIAPLLPDAWATESVRKVVRVHVEPTVKAKERT